MAGALVVYESMFGSSAAVARAVADGVAEVMPVVVAEVDRAPHDLAEYDLVLAGGPTHAHSMSSESTRREARCRGAQRGSVAVGLREWVRGLRHEDGPPVATFDTRTSGHPRLLGTAARGAARALRQHGLHEVARPESFTVLAVTGPLAPGETDRARAWGREVAARVPVPA